MRVGFSPASPEHSRVLFIITYEQSDLRALPPGYTHGKRKGFDIAAKEARCFLNEALAAMGPIDCRGYGKAIVCDGVRYYLRCEVHDKAPIGKHTGVSVYIAK